MESIGWTTESICFLADTQSRTKLKVLSCLQYSQLRYLRQDIHLEGAQFKSWLSQHPWVIWYSSLQYEICWQNVKKTALHWTAQNGNISCICHMTKQNFTWRPTPNPYSIRHLCFAAKVKFHKKRKQVYNIDIPVYQKYVSQPAVTRDLVRFEQLHQPKNIYDKQIIPTHHYHYQSYLQSVLWCCPS